MEPKYVCPICGEPVEVYSRPCGYLRPVSRYNDGKQQEFMDRVDFILDKHNDIFKRIGDCDIVGPDEPKIIQKQEK